MTDKSDTGVKTSPKSGFKKSPNDEGRIAISDGQLWGVLLVFVATLIFATYIGSWLGKFTVRVNFVD